MSSSIWSEIHDNIPIINENYHLPQNNSRINFTRPVRSEDEIILLIAADFHEKMNEDMKEWDSYLKGKK